MPVLKEYTRFGGEIRVGHIVHGKKVTAVDIKRVNTTVMYEDGSTQVIRKDTQITIGINEATPEEIRASAEKSLVKRVKNFCTGAQESWDQFEEKRAKRLADGSPYLDHWMIDEQMSTAATLDLATHISGLFESHPENEVALCIAIVSQYMDDLTNASFNRRVLSRSTSITSNICDDLMLAAKGSFVYSVRWIADDIPGLEKLAALR